MNPGTLIGVLVMGASVVAAPVLLLRFLDWGKAERKALEAAHQYATVRLAKLDREAERQLLLTLTQADRLWLEANGWRPKHWQLGENGAIFRDNDERAGVELGGNAPLDLPEVPPGPAQGAR